LYDARLSPVPPLPPVVPSVLRSSCSVILLKSSEDINIIIAISRV